MDKPYHLMTAAERLAARMAANRKIEQKMVQKSPDLSFDGIVGALKGRRQRASSFAVASLLQVPEASLMVGRPKTPANSWVVAAEGPQKGRPVGYEDSEIDPDCLRQIRSGTGNFIGSGDFLRKWLRQQ